VSHNHDLIHVSGEEKVPFTSGLLIGIGETREERLKAPEPPLAELEWTIAMARLMFGASMSIQAPPNLTPTMYRS
jgi:FO synthase